MRRGASDERASVSAGSAAAPPPEQHSSDPWGPPLGSIPASDSRTTPSTTASTIQGIPAVEPTAASRIDATTQTSERRLPPNAPPAPRIMIAVRPYDAMEGPANQLTPGYLAVVTNDILEVRSPAPVAGHQSNRFPHYLYAKSQDGRRGWVPDFALAPHKPAEPTIEV